MRKKSHPEIREASVESVLLKPQYFVWITMSIAGFTLIGWLANIQFLSGQWGSYIPMAPITALAFLFQGFTLLLCMRLPRKSLSRNIALASVIIISIFSLLVLIEFNVGIKLSIEQLLSSSSVTLNQIPVGRMSPLTAISFLLLNTSILILIIVQQKNQTTTSVAMFAISAASINFIIIAGYLFGSPLLYGGKTVPTALPTAVAFFSESIGLFLIAVPHSLILRSWSQYSFKGRLLRAFLFPIVGVVFLEAWFETRIEIHQPSNLLLFHALLILVFIIIIVIVIGLIARRMGDSLEQAEIIIQQQNEQLRELNASKDKFFSIIAHELKAPFLGFLGLTQDIAHNAGNISVQELTQLGRSMNQAAENLFNLLHNLLEWTQMQSGAISLLQKNISLSELITKNVQMIMVNSEQKGILINNLTKESIQVYADEKMVNSVLLNLLSNSVKFTKQKGTITISTKEIENKMIQVSIRDTGIGMPISIVEKLFILGEKTGRQGTDGELSTGLGLMLCKEFIEKNDGKIWAESEEDKGSTFYFTLPSFLTPQSISPQFFPDKTSP